MPEVNQQVTVETIYNSGTYYIRKFSHPDKIVLMEEVGRICAAIDPMRSPHVGSFCRSANGNWTVEVSHYGLD